MLSIFNPLKNYVDFLHSLLFSFHVILNDVMTAHPLLNLSTFRSYGSFLSDFLGHKLPVAETTCTVIQVLGRGLALALYFLLSH